MYFGHVGPMNEVSVLSRIKGTLKFLAKKVRQNQFCDSFCAYSRTFTVVLTVPKVGFSQPSCPQFFFSVSWNRWSQIGALEPIWTCPFNAPLTPSHPTTDLTVTGESPRWKSKSKYLRCRAATKHPKEAGTKQKATPEENRIFHC